MILFATLIYFLEVKLLIVLLSFIEKLQNFVTMKSKRCVRTQKSFDNYNIYIGKLTPFTLHSSQKLKVT